MLVAVFMFGKGQIGSVLWLSFREKPTLSVTVMALSTYGLSELSFDNCSVTQRAENYVSSGSWCIIDVGPFLPAALHGLCWEQEGYSLSLLWPLEAGQSGILLQNVTSFKGEKHESHLVIPVGYLCADSPLCRFSCTISWVIKDRHSALLSSSKVRACGAKRDFPLLCKHWATSLSLKGAINSCHESTNWLDIDLANG